MYDISNFASNMRKYRKAAIFTQIYLAKMLFISTQSISKWETGFAFPDLKNLCLPTDAVCSLPYFAKCCLTLPMTWDSLDAL